MNYQFSATLNAVIDISDNDFNFILDCCQHHYDNTVQAAVAVGGFLYGIKNRREWSKGKDQTMELSMRQLGLVLKSMEFVNVGQADMLGGRLYKIAEDLVKTELEINSSNYAQKKSIQ